jgi:peptidyl-prolyl cis-trans isomerase C
VKKIIILAALALAAVAGFAQDKPAAKPANPAPAPAPAQATAAEADPVIVSAGATTIHKSEFEQAIKSLPAEYQQMAQGPGKRQFADDFLRMKMLAAEGLKNGVDKDPEIQNQLNLMKENLFANAELKSIESSIKISDDELRKQYDDHKGDYEQVKARHILISYKGSRAPQKAGAPELTEEQAKAKAEELRKQILAGGDFAELAKKESDDTGSATSGGDLGAFGHGQMVPEFETAAFKAKPGEVTEVVKTPFGFHIIKVDAHDYTPFEGVKGPLERQTRQKKVQDALDAMKDSAKPTYNEAYFAPPPAPPAPAAVPSNDGGSDKPAAKPSASDKASAAKPSPAKTTTKKP